MHPSVVRAAIGGLMFCALASPCGAQTPNLKLMLDFSIQGQQSPFVLAAEGGYFARAGVNVEVDRGYGSADAITKVASRAYDMAFADIGALIQFRGKQIGAQVISVFQVYEVAPMLILFAEEVEHHQAERSCRQTARVAAGSLEPRYVSTFRCSHWSRSIVGELDRCHAAIARNLAGAGPDRRNHHARH